MTIATDSDALASDLLAEHNSDGTHKAAALTTMGHPSGSNAHSAIDTHIAKRFETDYVLIVDQKAQNTAGGTFTSGAWQTRELNTEVVDTGNVASVASNQITLAAGTYRYEISAPAYYVANHIAKLYNVTDAADVAFGTSESASNAAATTTRSFIKGRITIAAPKVFEVRHYCATTKSSDGFGIASNMAVEKYTVAEFFKEA